MLFSADNLKFTSAENVSCASELVTPFVTPFAALALARSFAIYRRALRNYCRCIDELVLAKWRRLRSLAG